MKKIFIACDHTGYKLKNKIIEWLNTINEINYIDTGSENEDKCDYPDYAHKISKLVSIGENCVGIVICGTGIGMSIVCNRYKNIRCANCHDIFTASMARKHNDSNILALGTRVISEELAIEIVKIFLETEFEGGRHIKRLEKIDK